MRINEAIGLLFIEGLAAGCSMSMIKCAAPANPVIENNHTRKLLSNTCCRPAVDGRYYENNS